MNQTVIYKNEINKRKENETLYLNKELQNLKKIINSYEDQNSIIEELEAKLKFQKNKYSKKIQEIEEIYSIEISELNKKITNMENRGFSQEVKMQKYLSNKIKSKTKNKFNYNYVIKIILFFKKNN